MELTTMRWLQLCCLLALSVSQIAWAQELQPQVLRTGNEYRLDVSGKTLTQSTSEIMRPTTFAPPNSRVVTATWAERREGEEVNFYAIRRPSGDWTTAKQADYRVRFKSGEFDPLAPAGAPFEANLIREAPAEDNNEASTYCVQFVTQSLPEYQQSLTNLGARVLDYMPNYSHVVSMTPAVAEKVRGLKFVRWVGPYQPAYKLSAELVPADARTVAGPTKFFVYTISKADTTQALKDIEALGGVGSGDTGGRLLEVTLTTEQISKVLELSTVQFIEEWSPIENDMDNARIQGGADYLVGEATTPDGFTGVGIRGHIMEGVNQLHPDFAANSHRALPIMVDDGTADGHGQATFGIVFGSGANDPTAKARGMLPNGQVSTRTIRFCPHPPVLRALAVVTSWSSD